LCVFVDFYKRPNPGEENLKQLATQGMEINHLHASLYPEYFTEYNFEAIRGSFEKLVQSDSSIFLHLED